MKLIPLCFLIALPTVFLQGQGQFEGGTFSLRLATTFSAKTDINPNYPANASVNYYAENSFGLESAIIYRFTRPKFRISAGLKGGFYPIDHRLSIGADQSLEGLEYSENLILAQGYYGVECAAELRLFSSNKVPIYLGPMAQMVFTQSATYTAGLGYVDQNRNIRDIYHSDYSTNDAERPYLQLGGKASIETQIAKRLGLGISLGYLFGTRELINSGRYRIYTVDGPLEGTFAKPFQYLFIGAELSLLRKKMSP